MQRVLYLSRTWQVGGAQTIILSLLRHLPGRGFEIVVAPYDTGYAADREFIDAARGAGARIAELSVPWSGKRDWFRARRAIRELVGRHGVDLVHTHDDLSSTLAAFAGLPSACARVATAYGWWERNRKVKLYFLIERHLALPRFDVVCTVADDLRRKIVAAGTDPTRVRVVHTGLEPEAFARRHARDEMRARFGLAADAIVVGTLCRLAPEKGLGVLLDAVHRLLPRHPQLALLIAGTGPERPLLEARARELGIERVVRFAGFVRDAGEAYAAMDVFALPSILPEGLPTTSLEAQAAGLPVIASDIGGTADTIERGVTGELVAPGDAAALAAALDRLVGDAGLRRRMAGPACARIEKEFAMPAMIDKMAAIYRDAIARRRAAKNA